ncbi:peptidylprolyl isomerase [Sphingorhabdus sp. EL138]|jgi:peptidyl-prolyl cis-trans isomerase SurA|uniref:peptidylprolyl isomerase n=1 Tax=Sphingorhabdus sp. EL138 TaxID=2073156 RepID=UPI0025D16B24|nr:peptidylprolyl isomerase [Sphingorhabdus sp. EL138]
MKLFTRLSLAALLVSASALTPLIAQAASDTIAPESNLNIPEGQQLFGKNDPNVRRATAQVNGEIITGTDIDHRLALIVAANDNKLPPEELARFRAQILTNLIDETLQIQEAAANEIEVTEAEVNQYFDRVAQQNFNRPANEVEKYLASIGASIATLKRQIKGELSWSRLLSRNVRPSANVSDDEVNAIIERIKATKGTTEYRLGEIYLAATPETLPAVQESVGKVIDQLRQGGNFVAYARQFSEASTASVGGDLGWLSLAQLPQSLATAAASMNSNEVKAVASPGGISILLLIDKRQVATSDPRDSVLSLKQIAINFPKGTTEAQVTPLINRFSEETQQISGCGVADEMARKLGADVVNRDGIKIRELPAPLQQVMLDLKVGQSTPPYGSLDDGVRVFVLCGRDAPQEAASESFDEIMSRLEEERVNKRARIYLRDLRRDAVIEYN